MFFFLMHIMTASSRDDAGQGVSSSHNTIFLQPLMNITVHCVCIAELSAELKESTFANPKN